MLVFFLFFLSALFFYFTSPQCTQGTKGLLESATLPPLLSTSCPQGKPQTAHTCPDSTPTVNSDPSPELSMSCGARHIAGSHGDNSPSRHTKIRSKKSKRVALHIPNPAFDIPVSPTSPDAASFVPLHWLTLMTTFSRDNTHCLKLACCKTVRYKYDFCFLLLFIGIVTE